MWKSNIGDFPLKNMPCEYWFVRYGVACTYCQERIREIWEPKLKEMEKKYKFVSFAYRGFGEFSERIKNSKSFFKKLDKYYANQMIELFEEDETGQRKLDKKKDKELWDFIEQYIHNVDIKWTDCPYEMNHQSKCPMYKVAQFYKGRSLKELRNHKGYEV